MMKVTMIGGPQDGKVFQMPEWQPTLAFACPTDLSRVRPNPEEIANLSFDRYFYHIKQLGPDTGIGVYEAMTLESAIDQMVRRYPPVNEKKQEIIVAIEACERAIERAHFVCEADELKHKVFELNRELRDIERAE